MSGTYQQSIPQNGDKSLGARLEEVYAAYSRREYVSPDPLQFLYEYEDERDIEAVGMIASSLAYGRVASILQSVRRVLDLLGPHPAAALVSTSESELMSGLEGFAHRFVKGPEMASFLSGVGRAIGEHGSLEELFVRHRDADGRAGTIRAMDGSAAEICRAAGLSRTHLLPRASLGSACKRYALFIRWMARSDDVDLGCWRRVSPRDILIPLDTHMFRISSGLGLTSRRAADGRAAIEITDGFANFAPDDPVKYDFALTRYGIRQELDVSTLLERLLRS